MLRQSRGGIRRVQRPSCSNRTVPPVRRRCPPCDTLNSKIIAFALSLAAEIERNLISQRTREALAAKKKAGVKLGRPKGMSRERQRFTKEYASVMQKIEAGETLSSIARWLKIHPNTLSRYLKEGFEPNEPNL